ncbi:MAG: tRNA glutamyl-Q(34) synthetase GluQRS [Rudaea sp.]
MSYRGRFAPSPTGPLHFGSLIAAAGSFVRARARGGAWLVRMEDLDPPREVPGAADDILATLTAFGMVADEPVVYQSQREAAYRRAFAQLRARDAVFPCWCSRSDLEAQNGLHLGACTTAPDKARVPAWRVRAADREIHFIDFLQGPQSQQLARDVGDFIVRRVEGWFAYQLAVVVDDADAGITEIVRGCDLLDSTPRQIYLQQLLHLPTPQYLHLPLALDGDGQKLSKTLSARPVDRHDPAPALRAALDFLGLGAAVRGVEPNPQALLASAIVHFDPSQLRKQSTFAAEADCKA